MPPKISMAAFHCRDSSRVISLENATERFRYAAICNGSSFFGDPIDSLHHEIHIPVSHFTPNSTNQVRMVMQNVCVSVLMDTLKIFHEAIPEPPVIVSAMQCGSDPAQVVTRSMAAKTRLDVFTDSLSESSLFSTPDSVFYLEGESAASFFVASSRSDGCASARVPIDIERRISDQTLWEENGMLFSRYESIWSFEGVQISTDTIAAILPLKDGLYAARTITDGCEIVTEIAYATDSGAEVFPVPFHDILHFALNNVGETIEHIVITSMDGRVAIAETPFPSNTAMLRTSHLENGIYIAHISSGTRRYRIKISRM